LRCKVPLGSCAVLLSTRGLLAVLAEVAHPVE
jgi:hypothetical protein